MKSSTSTKTIYQVYLARDADKMTRFLVSLAMLHFFSLSSISAQEDIVGRTVSKKIVSPLSKTITRNYRLLTRKTCKPLIFSIKFVVNDKFVCDSVLFSKNTDKLLADSIRLKISKIDVEWKNVLAEYPLSDKQKNYNLLFPIMITREECKSTSMSFVEYSDVFESIFICNGNTLSQVIIISPLTIFTTR